MNTFYSYLRPVTMADRKLIYNWRNKLEIRKLMFNDKTIDWETHIKWFDSLENDNKNDIKVFIEDNKPRGIVQVNQINTVHQTAEWGFYIGDPYKEGLGTILAYNALNYIFNELEIRKLSAQVSSINEKSLRFHQKLGFINEGILQKQIIKNEEIIDVHLFALFNDQWEQKKERLMEVCTHD